MKNLLKIATVLFIVAVASTATNAQNLRFGHIEMNALIQVMPEVTTAMNELEKYQSELEEVLDELNSKYHELLLEFEQLGNDVSEVRRNAKIMEIQELGQRSENFRNNAMQQLEQKYNDLLQPIYAKAENAIEEVARAQGLIYVFDSDNLRYKSNASVDVLPLVKERLGIK